jgi:TetR/AcrR family transcriptional regulator, tetracycline repressor protein
MSTQRSTPGRLNRAEVLRAAMTLLDRVGLQALTMRALAGELGVQVGGLYWHFADKQALLDAMSDELLAPVQAPDGSLPWLDQVRELARSVRAATMAHRDGGLLLAGRFSPQEHTVRTGGLTVEVLVRGGITPERAGSASFALLYYILGHAIEEQARLGLIAQGRWPGVIAGLDAAGKPDLITSFRAFDAQDAEERFERGLELFVTGIAAEARD